MKIKGLHYFNISLMGKYNLEWRARTLECVVQLLDDTNCITNELEEN